MRLSQNSADRPGARSRRSGIWQNGQRAGDGWDTTMPPPNCC